MKKKIYKYIFMLAVVFIFITTIFCMTASYRLISNQIEDTIRNTTYTLNSILKNENNPIEYLDNTYYNTTDYRISLIKKDGEVIYDNFENQENLDNHSNRPEVQDAFNNGHGETTRFSKTLGEKTYYYATPINNDTVLRVSKTTNAIFSIFKTIFPLISLCILLSLVICHFASLKLVQRVIEPINMLDFNSESINIYDELSPFVNTIKRQRLEIAKQFDTLESRTNTIKTITQNMKEGIILVDDSKKILLVNNSILNQLSISNNVNFIGKNIIELIRDRAIQDCIESTLTGISNDLIYNIDNKSIQVILNPVLVDNTVNGCVILFIDITKKANAEKLRREFSANVSHELKTPLTTILGLSELLYNDMVDSNDFIKFGEKIKNESQRLLTLIDNILKVSQLDEKSFTNTFEYIEITPIIQEIIVSLDRFIKSKNITISITSNNEIIYGNPQLLHELLFNVIENSIKYNKINGFVTINTSYIDKKVKIEIFDTGIGIEQVNQERIFERFYRVDKSRYKKTGGSGLGLAIVKHIVENHNGTLVLDSQVNIGSNFTIII